MTRSTLLALAACLFALGVAPAGAADLAAARAAILDGLAAEAKAADPGFKGFSAERGQALFLSKNTSGKPETPSCTTCHTAEPTQMGQTRAGKEIDPIALSKTPDRFSDPEKVVKWFGRNCNSVLGRACTALERGDVLTFFIAR